MADVSLTSLKGSNTFITKFASPTVVVSSGATGTHTTITPPAGQRVKLTSLGAQVLQTNLTTVSVGGSVVVNAVLVEGVGASPSSTNEFLLGYGSPNQEPIVGEVGQALTISTNVATSSNMYYAYQFGV